MFNARLQADCSSNLGNRLCERAKRPRSLGRSLAILPDEASFVSLFPTLAQSRNLRSGCLGFIRGLLENVGAEIDPLRLIRRIKNGLEIPGLKPALIKILQDFNLQVSRTLLLILSQFSLTSQFLRFLQLSLMEGCKSILYSDCRHLTLSLHDSQTAGFLWTSETKDKLTGESVYPQLAGGAVPATLPLGVSQITPSTVTYATDELLLHRFASSPAKRTSALQLSHLCRTTLSSLHRSQSQPSETNSWLLLSSLHQIPETILLCPLGERWRKR